MSEHATRQEFRSTADTPEKLAKQLTALSQQATPGPWAADPRRLYIGDQAGPVMSYLYGNAGTPEGMRVSLASERHADHYFVAELVNAWRAGKLRVRE